jgi:GntR family transcriptional regulator
MPIHVIPGITEEVLAGSIYDYIETRLKLGIGAANRMIGADKPNKDDEEYLRCQIDDPVLEVDQVVFLDNGVAFEYSQTRRRYDKGHIVMVNLNKKKDR